MADVGSINYKSEKTEFLDDKTIKSIKDSIKSGITNITESLVTVIDDESGNGLSEESFNVDGEGIIYNKSQEIKKDIESFTDKSSDFSNVLKTIEDHGHAHMAEEAEKWKKERKKHYNQLYDTLKTNVNTYNTFVTIHNNEEYQKQNNTETSYTPKIKEHIKAYKDKNEKVQLSAKPSSLVQYHDQVNAAYEEALAFYPKYKEAVDYYDQLKGSYGDYFASSNILTRVFATSGNLVVAFTSGIVKFNEGIDDMGLFVKGHCKSALNHFLGEIAEDFGFEEKGAELKKAGNKIKERYNKEIMIDHTQETLDRFYENNKVGKWLDRNSYISHDSTAYQLVSAAGQAVPTVAAGAILTALTGGTAAPGVVTALGATLGGSTALGQTAESHYQKTGGKDTAGGYLKMAGFTALGALGGGAEAQAGARYATKVLSSSTKIKLPKDALKDSLDNVTKKSDTSIGKNVDNLSPVKSQKNISSLEEKIADGQISNLSEAKKAGFTEYEYNSARAGEAFENELANLKKPVSSTLENKIADGQISNIDDAMKSGYSAKEYKEIANAGQKTNKINVSSLEEKIADGQISNLSEAKKAGFTEYEYNSARAGEVFDNKISSIKKPVSSTLEEKIADGQISNIDDAIKSGYSAKDYRDIANAGQQVNKVNVSTLEENPNMIPPESVSQTRIEKLKNGASQLGSNIKTVASNRVDNVVSGVKEMSHKAYDATIGNAKEFSSDMAQGAKAKVGDMYQGAKDTAAEKTSDLFSWFRRKKPTSESPTVENDIDNYLSGKNDIDNYLSGNGNQTKFEVGDEAETFFGGHNQ